MVCIPWASAHVSTGRRDATNWSQHLECCDQIEKLAAQFDPQIPTIVAGDFNQRIPRRRQPIRAHPAARGDGPLETAHGR